APKASPAAKPNSAPRALSNSFTTRRVRVACRQHAYVVPQPSRSSCPPIAASIIGIRSERRTGCRERWDPPLEEERVDEELGCRAVAHGHQFRVVRRAEVDGHCDLVPALDQVEVEDR